MKKATYLRGSILLLLYFGMVTAGENEFGYRKKSKRNCKMSITIDSDSGEYTQDSFSSEPDFNVNCTRLKFKIKTDVPISLTCNSFSVVNDGTYEFKLKAKKGKNKQRPRGPSDYGRKKRNNLPQIDDAESGKHDQKSEMEPEGLDGHGRAMRSEPGRPLWRKGGKNNCELPTCYRWNSTEDSQSTLTSEGVLTYDLTSGDKPITFEVKSIKDKKKKKDRKKKNKTYLNGLNYKISWSAPQTMMVMNKKVPGH